MIFPRNYTKINHNHLKGNGSNCELSDERAGTGYQSKLCQLASIAVLRVLGHL